jgi:pyruvate-formate lyase-activating enzyme
MHIKDINPVVYKRYTGKNNALTIANLKWLVEQGKVDKITFVFP